MPSDQTGRALRDILRHIDLAAAFVADLQQNAFEADIRAVYAVTRCLEIIAEASRRLPDGLKLRHPSIAWRQMAAAGNVYRHQYEYVASHFIWETVQQALSPLRHAVEAEIALLKPPEA
jgi:uncharacterized protein with HEPN domain